MKPPPFDYSAPTETGEALGLLAQHGDEAKVLAGGQSLIPLLNFRLARPSRLIDISRIPSLSYVQMRDDALLIGATTTQAAAERSPVVAREAPVLVEALRHVAHFQIRNLGTIGGSVAHADPSAELPAVFSAQGAKFHLRSVRGARRVAANEFFVSYFTTVLEPDEVLVEIEIPRLQPGTGCAFVEFARRHGDFALAGATAVITLDATGVCLRASLTLLGTETPWRAQDIDTVLAGDAPDNQGIAEAAHLAIQGFAPAGDIHGSAEYRTSLAEVMARRALQLAIERARSAMKAE